MGNSKTTVQRSSNLELMRILLMIGMVAHHCVVNSGVEELYDLSRLSGEVLFFQIFGMFGKTGINCFTLLTGYFMITSNTTLRKFLKLYLEVKFYYLGFYLLFLLTGYEPFSLTGLKAAVFNVLYEVNWLYTGTYIVFFLAIPFLNAAVRHISQKQYLYLLILGFVYYTVISTFTELDTFSYLGWMAVMYLLGGYFAIYKASLPFVGSLRFAAAGLAVSLALMCLSIAAIDVFGYERGFSDYYYFVNDSHKILALLTSVFLFLTFMNLRIPQNRWINRIAASTFGILLIHTNSGAMRRFLWRDLFDIPGIFEQGGIAGAARLFAAAALVFLAALAIDQLRISLVERPLMKRLDSWKWLRRMEEKTDALWRTTASEWKNDEKG